MPARTFAVASLLSSSLLAAALSAGCSGDASSADPAQPRGAPPLSKAQAQQVLASYTEGANRAGGRFDRRALRAIETDPQLAMDTATLRMRRAVRQPAPKLAFREASFYIPRLGGYPQWFAAGAVTGQGKQARRHAMLFTRAKAGAPWLLASDPRPGDDPLSRVALDPDGYATPVAQDAEGLAVPPRKLPAAHAALLTEGPRAEDASVIADGPQTSETYKALTQGAKTLAGRGVTLSSRFSAAPYTVYALRTKDRGALVWYVLKQNEAYSASNRGKLGVSGDLVGLAPARTSRTRMDTTVLVQYLATVPPEGRATVNGMYRKAVSVR
ncbi:hypothetical protein E1281_15940 [Actinomadura sp. KC345]|uniref:hypothetical protein n=1 Tax=Actinomadura sp. KC345 TaxID=2530371 RepID=UPI00104B1BAF|nr:hypothetical protein [Actinomadura sp. KC345]TDC54657.1 hypothetical protein E1281_15940 [Actinomadura sp. KC345]